MTPPSPTTSTNVKSIVAAFEFARMRRELERRHQRLDKLFTTTSVVSATPSPAPLASLSSPASSTAPPPPTSTDSASIDNTTRSSTTTREPLQAPPARCSTPGPSHDKCALVPVNAAPATSSISSRTSFTSTAAPTSPPPATAAAPTSTPAQAILDAEEVFFTTTPIRCSMTCLSSGNRLGYITSSTPAYRIEVMWPGLAIKVYDAQKGFERKIDEYSVVLWPSFTGCLGLVLLRQPWPPPIQFEFMGTVFLVGCSTASCVFDCGKSRSEFTLAIILHGTPLQANISFFLLEASSVALQLGVQVNEVQLRPTPWSSFTCRALAVKWEASLPMMLICSVNKCTLNCEFIMQCCNQCLEFLESALPIDELVRKLSVGLLQSFQGTMLGALAILPFHSLMLRRTMMLVGVQKSWALLHGHRRNVVFQFSVLHHVAFCKVHWPPPVLVCMAGNGLPGATVSFNRQVILQCYPYRVQAAVQWSDSEYESDFTYTHVASTKKLPDYRVLLLGLLATNSAQEYWLVSLQYLSRLLCTASLNSDELLFGYLTWQAQRVSSILQKFLHALFECWSFHDGDEKDTVKQFIPASHKCKLIFSYCCSVIGTEKLFKISSFILNTHSWVSDMMVATNNCGGQCPDYDRHFISRFMLHFMSNVANIQWPWLLSAKGQKNNGTSRVEMAALTIASSIILRHVVILWFTMSKQLEKSILDASNLVDRWLNIPGCSSCVFKMRPLTPYNHNFMTLSCFSHCGHVKPLAVPVLKWSICWVFTNSKRIHSYPPILSKLLQLQISFSSDQWPLFSWQLFIGVYDWECNSNGKADVATFSNCKCKFAVTEPAYVLLLSKFDVLTAGYLWPCNLGTALSTSQYVILVLLSTVQLSGRNWEEVMSPG